MLNISALPAFYNPGNLSALQIESLFNHATGTSVIDFSFRLLDRNLIPVPVPGGAASDPAELPPTYVQKATVEMNTTRDVHRQMTLDLIELPGLQYNPLFHRLQPYCDFYQSGVRVLHIPLGIFMGVLPDRDLSDQYPVWHLTLYDETWRLARLKFLNNWVVPAGSSFIGTVYQLLELAMLPPSQGGSAVTPAGCDMAGPFIPASRINIPMSDAVLPVDVTFTPTDTFLSAINSLLLAADQPYWPLWQDEVGTFTSKPQPYFTIAQPDPGWAYDSARVYDPATGQGNIIKPPVKQSFSDQTNLANCVKVYCESGAAAAFFAVAYNNNLQSAISIPNYGEMVTKIISDDKLGSETTAYLRANIELQLAATLNDTISFDAVVVPVHQVHDGLPITIRGAGTTTYTGSGATLGVTVSDGPTLISSAGGPFIEISWAIDCTTRIASHSAGTTIAV
jgi:hypothetical protein